MSTTKKFSLIGIVIAVVVVLGGGIWISQTNNKVSAATTEFGTLANNYGLYFTPGHTTSGVISQQQALSIVQPLFTVSPSQMTTTFGYLDMNQNEKRVVVLPNRAAYQKSNKGALTNYPVWVIKVSGLDIPPHLARKPANGSNQTDNNTAHTNVIYEFIDAINGQVLFGVGGHIAN